MTIQSVLTSIEDELKESYKNPLNEQDKERGVEDGIFLTIPEAELVVQYLNKILK